MDSETKIASTEKNSQLKVVAHLLSTSKHAIAFTGAGISTPSGIPDFRSPKSGLWNTSDPYKVASIWAFKNSPKDFFDWIRPLAINAETARPNSAHLALAKLESLGIIKSVITQNIDGLHHKAGSHHVLELHGTAQTATCPSCGKKHQRDYFHQKITSGHEFPRCIICGKIIKPDVILFGEELPQGTWSEAHQECLMADLVLVAGSSLEVSPASSLPEIALMNGAILVINNLGRTFLDEKADVLLKVDVEQGVGRLLEFFA